METNRDDRIIAEVRAVRDEYAAHHHHDIAAIFSDIGNGLVETGNPVLAHHVASWPCSPLGECLTTPMLVNYSSASNASTSSLLSTIRTPGFCGSSSK